MAFIPDVHLSGSFVNLNTETGFAVNQNFFIQNKSSKDVIVVRSPTIPVNIENGIHLRAYEEFILPPTTDYYWAYGLGDIQFVNYLTQVSITGQPLATTSLNLDQVLKYYPNVVQPRLRTEIITSSESFTLQGFMYRAVIEFDAVPAGEVRWIRMRAPSDKWLFIANRRLACEVAGARYHLFTDSTNIQLSATTYPAYNMGNHYIPQLAQSSITLLSTPPTIVTNKGRILQIGKGGSGGVGNTSAGTSAREDGFTMYTANTGFEARISNTSTVANDLTLTLEFAEVPTSVIAP